MTDETEIHIKDSNDSFSSDSSSLNNINPFVDPLFLKVKNSSIYFSLDNKENDTKPEIEVNLILDSMEEAEMKSSSMITQNDNNRILIKKNFFEDYDSDSIQSDPLKSYQILCREWCKIRGSGYFNYLLHGIPVSSNFISMNICYVNTNDKEALTGYLRSLPGFLSSNQNKFKQENDDNFCYFHPDLQLPQTRSWLKEYNTFAGTPVERIKNVFVNEPHLAALFSPDSYFSPPLLISDGGSKEKYKNKFLLDKYKNLIQLAKEIVKYKAGIVSEFKQAPPLMVVLMTQSNAEDVLLLIYFCHLLALFVFQDIRIPNSEDATKRFDLRTQAEQNWYIGLNSARQIVTQFVSHFQQVYNFTKEQLLEIIPGPHIPFIGESVWTFVKTELIETLIDLEHNIGKSFHNEIRLNVINNSEDSKALKNQILKNVSPPVYWNDIMSLWTGEEAFDSNISPFPEVIREKQFKKNQKKLKKKPVPKKEKRGLSKWKLIPFDSDLIFKCSHQFQGELCPNLDLCKKQILFHQEEYEKMTKEFLEKRRELSKNFPLPPPPPSTLIINELIPSPSSSSSTNDEKNKRKKINKSFIFTIKRKRKTFEFSNNKKYKHDKDKSIEDIELENNVLTDIPLLRSSNQDISDSDSDSMSNSDFVTNLNVSKEQYYNSDSDNDKIVSDSDSDEEKEINSDWMQEEEKEEREKCMESDLSNISSSSSSSSVALTALNEVINTIHNNNDEDIVNSLLGLTNVVIEKQNSTLNSLSQNSISSLPIVSSSSSTNNIINLNKNFILSRTTLNFKNNPLLEHFRRSTSQHIIKNPLSNSIINSSETIVLPSLVKKNKDITRDKDRVINKPPNEVNLISSKLNEMVKNIIEKEYTRLNLNSSQEILQKQVVYILYSIQMGWIIDYTNFEKAVNLKSLNQNNNNNDVSNNILWNVLILSLNAWEMELKSQFNLNFSSCSSDLFSVSVKKIFMQFRFDLEQQIHSLQYIKTLAQEYIDKLE